MQWFNEFPCLALDCVLDDDQAGRLDLVGPRTGERVGGGALAAFGVGFTSIALGAARWIPGPFKLVPLGMAVVGGGLAGWGALGATGRVLLRVERGRGVTLSWQAGPLAPREEFLDSDGIAAWEVCRRQRSHGQVGQTQWSELYYVLALVTRDGRAIDVEHFATEAQAGLRKQALERVLHPAPPRREKTASRPRKARSRARRQS